MKTSRLPPSADGFVPTWSCSRRGLPGHLHYCKCRWSFTPPFHHHLVPLRVTGLSVSVALIRQVNSSRRCSPPRVLSDAVLYGVRTFLDPDNAEPRSPNRPEATSSYTQGKGASTAAGRCVVGESVGIPLRKSRHTLGDFNWCDAHHRLKDSFGLFRFWRENPYHEGSQRYTKGVFWLFSLCAPLSPWWLKKGSR
jgi:hypothetical protein